MSSAIAAGFSPAVSCSLRSWDYMVPAFYRLHPAHSSIPHTLRRCLFTYKKTHLPAKTRIEKRTCYLPINTHPLGRPLDPTGSIIIKCRLFHSGPGLCSIRSPVRAVSTRDRSTGVEKRPVEISLRLGGAGDIGGIYNRMGLGLVREIFR